MYTLRVERTICAAHALQMGGQRERVHGHHWRVELALTGPSLDADGLLVDFHQVERDLHALLEPFHNNCFNDVPPFDRINPSAELVAQWVATQMAQRMPKGVRVQSASVSEAPGCVATYTAPEGRA